MKNNTFEPSLYAILEQPSSGGSAFSNPPQQAFRSSKSVCIWFQRRDIKSDFIIVAAGATLLVMASFAISYFFRFFTWRKDPPVVPNRFGTSGVGVVDSAPSATTTPAPMLASASISQSAPALQLGEIIHVTSPIEPSEAPRHARVLASEDLLRKDWDSQEDDTAWANL